MFFELFLGFWLFEEEEVENVGGMSCYFRVFLKILSCSVVYLLEWEVWEDEFGCGGMLFGVGSCWGVLGFEYDLYGFFWCKDFELLEDKFVFERVCC